MGFIELLISTEGDKKLKKLKKLLELDDEEDVILEALCLYDWVIEKIKGGDKIAALKKISDADNDNVYKLIIPRLKGLNKLREKINKKNQEN